MENYKGHQSCTSLIVENAIKLFGLREWTQVTEIRNLKWK